MKTFQEFRSNINELDEGVVSGLIGLGFAANSAYSGLKNLRKGNYKGAAMDAVGMVPGGRAFKGIKALGGSKKLAKLGSFTQSAIRHGTDNAYSRAYSKVWDTAINTAINPQTYKNIHQKGKKLYNKMKGK
tara:strand:+ start:51 stop:443 length:393 start_codon:yes stop_codon:yes gene_type:complete